MVALKSHLTLLALSVASLSLLPGSEAAALPIRAPSMSSPVQYARRQVPPTMPMSMRAKKRFAGFKHRPRDTADISRKRKFLKSRILEPLVPIGEVFGKRHPQEQAHFSVKERRQDSSSLPGQYGRVDIMNNGTMVGSLVMNTTSSPPVLDASSNNHTNFNMVPTDNNLFTLQTLMNTTEGLMPFCATYDPQPPAPAPLTVTRCQNTTTDSQPHKSQVFDYDASSGVLRPRWGSGASSVAGNGTAVSSQEIDDEQASDDDEDAGDNDTTGGDDTDGDSDTTGDNDTAGDDSDGAPLNSRDASGSANVELVFVPDQEPSAAAEQVAPIETTTVTTTVTTSASATPDDRVVPSTTLSSSPSSSVGALAVEVNTVSSSVPASSSVAQSLISSTTTISSSATSTPSSSATMTPSSSATMIPFSSTTVDASPATPTDDRASDGGNDVSSAPSTTPQDEQAVYVVAAGGRF